MGSPTNDIRFMGGGGVVGGSGGQHHSRISPQEETSRATSAANNRYASIAAARHAQVKEKEIRTWVFAISFPGRKCSSDMSDVRGNSLLQFGKKKGGGKDIYKVSGVKAERKLVRRLVLCFALLSASSCVLLSFPCAISQDSCRKAFTHSQARRRKKLFLD